MEKQAWIVQKQVVENNKTYYDNLYVYLDEETAWSKVYELNMALPKTSDDFYGLYGPIPLMETI